MKGSIVKEGEICVKNAQSNFGQNKTIDLFGVWQTEKAINSLNPDGSLPRNSYGNYELFYGDPPPGTFHLKLVNLPRLCKKYKIDYVEVVTGFETV